MPRQNKAAHRAKWMQEFEQALREACDAARVEFPAGHIDWTSASYHYSISTPPQNAATLYVGLRLLQQ